MQIAPLPPDENQRLEALYSLHLLNTPPESRFDDLVALAAELFQVPVAFISLVDRNRQWLKAKAGTELCETQREVSFCSHAILQKTPLIIEDATRDTRFAQNPLVTGNPFLRFYAGHPLQVDGHNIGTLCLADTKPRSLRPHDLANLTKLARMAERELAESTLLEDQSRLLKVQKELLNTRRQLSEEHAAAASYVRSLLPRPLFGPLRIDWEFQPSQQLGGDCLGYHELEPGKLAIYLFDVCGHGVGAALLSVALLSVLRSSSLAGVNFAKPSEVLRGLNREFPMARHNNRFVTLWYGVYTADSGRLSYATAGHPAGVLVQQDGEVQTLSTGGIPIGCMPKMEFAESETQLTAGDVLYVFSDGLFELRRPDGRTEVSFDTVVTRLGNHSTPEAPLERVLAEVSGLHKSSPLADDVSLMRIHRP